MCGVLTTGWPRKSHLIILSNPHSDRLIFLLKSLNSFLVALAIKTKLLLAWPIKSCMVWSFLLLWSHPPPYSVSNALAMGLTGPLHLLFSLPGVNPTLLSC
ncbi:unnamed protein product [Rangifer tarandus platyrhynchus]|uniref:Uncharacterized protein n=1 Tax=Rangifer tarandus platyrhynchus TaxID=3082113 RepID=A0AC59Y3P3_RANTA